MTILSRFFFRLSHFLLAGVGPLSCVYFAALKIIPKELLHKRVESATQLVLPIGLAAISFFFTSCFGLMVWLFLMKLIYGPEKTRRWAAVGEGPAFVKCIIQAIHDFVLGK